MYQCVACGCCYDPGDLRGGVCEDCREQEREQERRMEARRRRLAEIFREQADGQIVMP